MARHLLDTTVLIDYLQGERKTVELVAGLANQGHELGICCVNVAEVYSGLGKEDRGKAYKLINSLGFYEISREIAIEAGSYRFQFARKGITLTVSDTLIAATAIAYGATLVTANVSDYPMEGLAVLQQP